MDLFTTESRRTDQGKALERMYTSMVVITMDSGTKIASMAKDCISILMILNTLGSGHLTAVKG